MTSLVMGSSLLSLREELAGSWPQRGLSPPAPGPAVTAASALEGRDSAQKRARITHVHVTCLKLIGRLPRI